jgi:hypothetical protein
MWTAANPASDILMHHDYRSGAHFFSEIAPVSTGLDGQTRLRQCSPSLGLSDQR